MKKFYANMLGLASLAFMLSVSMACSSDKGDGPDPDPEQEQKEEKWEWALDFEDNFDGPEIDEKVWTKIPRGKPDWANTQADFDDRCFEFRNGALVLKGIANNPAVEDDTEYHTGGIWSKGKKGFEPGKFEIRVRMKNCKGAWPAVWLMPFKQEKDWPVEGEIDIMETLNFDTFAYQTVHSSYTQKNGNYPQKSKTSAIKVNDWNVFGVEIHKDKVVFFINGTQTHEYKKLSPEVDGQFPFYREQELRIDQQLGGSWVGDVDLAGEIAEMEVDWVKHYVKKIVE